MNFNKSFGSSTLATSTKSNSRAISRGKEGFFTFIWRKAITMALNLWARLRKFMWVGSTGFIILVVPFVFGYLQEMQNQMARMMAMEAGNKVI